MTSTLQVRCRKCQTLLKVKATAETTVQFRCVSCGCLLRVKVTDSGTNRSPDPGAVVRGSTPEEADLFNDQSFAAASNDLDAGEGAWDDDSISANEAENLPQLPPRSAKSLKRNRQKARDVVDGSQNVRFLDRLPKSVRDRLIWAPVIFVIIGLWMMIFVFSDHRPVNDPFVASGDTSSSSDAGESQFSGAAQQRADDFPSVILPSAYEHLLVNENGRQLAGVEKEGFVLNIFDFETLKEPRPEPRRIPVPAGCQHAAFKPFATGGFYCVLGQDGALQLLDSEQNQASRSIPVQSTQGSALLASKNSEDPWVFVLTPTSTARLTAVHVVTGETIVQEFHVSTSMPRIGSSGQYLTFGDSLFIRDDVTLPPNQMKQRSLSTMIGNLVHFQVFFAHRDQLLVAGPETFDVLSGSATRVTPVANFLPAVSAACAFHDMPIMVSVLPPSADYGIQFPNPGDVFLGTISSNSGSRYPGIVRLNFGKNETTEDPQGPLSSVPAAQGMLESFQRNSEVREIQLFPDDRNKQLFCVVGRELKVVPAEALDGSDEPLCLFPSIPPGPYSPGQKIDIALNSAKGVKTTIRGPLPEGAKLTNDRFEWVPGEFQLGTHPLIFDYQTEVSQRSLTVNIDVDYPQFLLPEEPDLIVYGKASGSLYGFDSDSKTITRFELQNQDGVSQCVSCAKRDFPWSISSIVEKVSGDKTFVCVASQGNGPPTVHVMDAVSLEEIGKIEVPTGCSMLHASDNPSDSIVYYSSSSSKQSGAISLATLTNTGQLQDVGQLSLISPDGQYAFNADSKLFLRADPIEGARPRFKFVKAFPPELRFDEKTIVDSESSFFYISGQVYSPLSSDSPVASEQPVIHLENDVVITAREEPDEIIFTRQHQNSEFSEDLSIAMRKPTVYRLDRKHVGEFVVVDSARNRIVVLRGQAVAVHPLSRLRMENKPAMVARMEHGPIFVASEEKTSAFSPVAPEDIIEIVELPTGMTFRDLVLSWRPVRNQIGDHLLRYRIHRGNRVVSRTLLIKVLGSKSEAESLIADASRGRSLPDIAPVDSDPKMDQTPSASTASSDEQLVSMSLSPVGTAALLSHSPAKVRLYRTQDLRTGTPEKSVADLDLPAAPVSVFARKLGGKDVFILLTGDHEKASEIRILDANTLHLISTFPLGTLRGWDLLLSEDERDVWAFFTATALTKQNERADLRAVNLLSGEVTNPILPASQKASVSADGRLLVSQGYPGEGDLALLLRAGDGFSSFPVFKKWKSVETHAGGYLSTHPFAFSSFSGARLWDSSLSDHKSARLVFLAPPVFLRQKAVLIGAVEDLIGKLSGTGSDGISLCCFSTRGFELVGTPALITASRVPVEKSPAVGFVPHVKLIADEARERIICLLGNELIIIPYEELQVPDAADLNVRFRLPEKMELGTRCEILLEIPKSDPPLTVVNSVLLPGMELTGDRIQWRPMPTQYGLSEISITVSNGEATHTSRCVIDIDRRRFKSRLAPELTVLSTHDGSLVAASPDGKRLSRHSIQEGQIQEEASASLELTESLKSIVSKKFGDRHLLVLGTKSTSPIQILDAVTFDRVAEIPADGWTPSSLQSSRNPTDPFLYFARDNRTWAASLKTNSVVGSVLDQAERFFIAPSGVYGYASINTGSDAPKPTLAVRDHNFRDASPSFSLSMRPSLTGLWNHSMVPDEYGIFTIVDGLLVDAEQLSLRAVRAAPNPAESPRSGSDREGYAAAFMNHGEVLLSLRRNTAERTSTFGSIVELVAASADDGSRFGTVAISADSESKPFYALEPPAWKVLVDDVNRRVVCLNGDEIVVVPADELNVPQGSPLKAIWTGPRVADVARETRWSLYGVPDDASIEYIDLPTGALQSEAELVWTPTSGQVGTHLLRAQVKRENKTVTVSYEVNVEWPTLTLPFSPVGVAVEEYGPRVAVWQRSEIVDDKIIDNNRGYLHTVNTANGKSLFSGRLLDDNPSGLITSGIVAGDHFVFYNRLPDESQLWRIPLEGGRAAERMNIPGDCRKSISSIAVIGNHLLAEFTDRVVFFNLATMKFEREIWPTATMIPRPVLAEGFFGTMLYGVAIDEELKPLIAIRPSWYSDPLDGSPEGTISESDVGTTTEQKSPSTIHKGDIRISVALDQNDGVKKTVENRGSPDPLQYLKVPIQERPRVQHWSRRITGELRFENSQGLVLNRPLGNMDFRLYDDFIGFHYHARATDVVVCAGRRLMLLPFPKPDELKFGEDERFAAIVPETGHVLLSSTGKTTLNHKVLGDVKGTRMRSECLKTPGLEFLPQTSRIEIDAPRLRSSLTELRAKACLAKEIDKVGSREQRVDAMLKRLKDEQRSQSREVLKYDGQDLLEPIPIVLQLTDQDERIVTQISYFVYIELRMAELREKLLRGIP